MASDSASSGTAASDDSYERRVKFSSVRNGSRVEFYDKDGDLAGWTEATVKPDVSLTPAIWRAARDQFSPKHWGLLPPQTKVLNYVLARMGQLKSVMARQEVRGFHLSRYLENIGISTDTVTHETMAIVRTHTSLVEEVRDLDRITAPRVPAAAVAASARY